MGDYNFSVNSVGTHSTLIDYHTAPPPPLQPPQLLHLSPQQANNSNAVNTSATPTTTTMQDELILETKKHQNGSGENGEQQNNHDYSCTTSSSSSISSIAPNSAINIITTVASNGSSRKSDEMTLLVETGNGVIGVGEGNGSLLQLTENGRNNSQESSVVVGSAASVTAAASAACVVATTTQQQLQHLHQLPPPQQQQQLRHHHLCFGNSNGGTGVNTEVGHSVPGLNPNTSSFWSAEENFMQSMQPLNGALQNSFQNFPSSHAGTGLGGSGGGGGGGPSPTNTIFNVNPNLGLQQAANMSAHHISQRRPITVGGGNSGYPTPVTRPTSSIFVPSSTNKGFVTSGSSWNAGGSNLPPQNVQSHHQQQQGGTLAALQNNAANTWSTGGSGGGPIPNCSPTQAPNCVPPPHVTQTPWSNIQQRQQPRPVPNLSPISPMKKTDGNTGAAILGGVHQQQAMIISPSRFRRSTSYPGKGYPGPIHPGVAPNLTFELSGTDQDPRDAITSLLPFQDRLLAANHGHGPLDNMRGPFEHCLNDMMRYNGDNQDHLKARSYGRRRGKSPFFPGLEDNHLLEDGHLDHQSVSSLNSPSRSSPRSQGSSDLGERFSRKVFVGGLPPDIDEEEITTSFRRFGPLVVDWPHKAESKSYFPPKGYAFLLFQNESSVQSLIDACIQDDDKLYLCVSSPTIKDKPVQIRPWRLSDADFVLDGSLTLDPRKTVFVGGVPRPLKAVELAMIMDRLYGGVCYAGIDTDPELKYPKGAGRVAFSNQQSYIAAISARFVQLQHGDIDKRVEVKPYVLDDQLCDECQGARCGGKFAPFFCANVTCLQYYCEQCWATIHSRAGREFHKPLVKEGADRPRTVPFRWC